MNGKVAREFRKQAALRTIGMSAKQTRTLYQFMKKVYKSMKSGIVK